MNSLNKLYPLQAFSYLSGQNKSLWQEGKIVGTLLLGMIGIMFLPFPASWIKSYVTTSSAFFYLASGLFLLIKAFFFSEFLFYFLHRYFEHLGLASRLSPFIQQNQQYHWIHHMIVYPLNKQYKKSGHYISLTRGFTSTAWRMFIGSIIILMSILAMGISWQATLFDLCIFVYAKSIAHTHDRFHYSSSWDQNRYFQWLSDIHILHHFDQTKNFTIVLPLMDILFGTYAPPRKVDSRLREYLQNNDLNPSDFINFSYLIKEAKPVETAVFISGLKRFSGERRKVELMIQTLEQIQEDEPYGHEALFMRQSLSQYVELASEHQFSEKRHIDKENSQSIV